MSILKSAKRFVCFVFFAASLLPGFSADFFSDTEIGGAADLLPSSTKTAEIRFRGFYRTQIQIGERFLANAGVSLNSDNIFAGSSFRSIPSFFNIDELSLMYRFKIEKALAQFSFFAGEYESAGNDIFAQRYLGTKSFNSYLLEKETGLPSPSIIPIEGIGGAFTIKYGIPFANAFYVYYRENADRKYVNTDIRLSGLSNALIADFVFGTTLPIEKKDANGDNVVLIIRRADFHTGFTLLLGDNPFVNLFIQAGITRIQSKPDPSESILSFSDLYAFFEPRFAIRKVLFSLSAFHLPADVYGGIPHIDYPLGAAFMIKSVPLNFKSNQGVFGAIICSSTVNPMTAAFSMQKLSVQFVPFAQFSGPHGLFKIKLFVKPFEYTDSAKTVSLSASYKIRF